MVGFEHAAGDFYDYELMPRKELKEGTHIVVHNDEVVGVTFAGVVDETEGRLDYVAADPRFSGKGIGYAVCAGVTRHLLERGYKTVMLMTDDWRPPRDHHVHEGRLRAGDVPRRYAAALGGRPRPSGAQPQPRLTLIGLPVIPVKTGIQTSSFGHRRGGSRTALDRGVAPRL